MIFSNIRTNFSDKKVFFSNIFPNIYFYGFSLFCSIVLGIRQNQDKPHFSLSFQEKVRTQSSKFGTQTSPASAATSGPKFLRWQVPYDEQVSDEEAPADIVNEMPVQVKLANFWPNNAAVWFVRAEQEFVIKDVSTQATKYAYLVQALTEEVSMRVADV